MLDFAAAWLRGQRGKLKIFFENSRWLNRSGLVHSNHSESQFFYIFHALKWVYCQSSERINVRAIYHKLLSLFDANSSSHTPLSLSLCLFSKGKRTQDTLLGFGQCWKDYHLEEDQWGTYRYHQSNFGFQHQDSTSQWVSSNIRSFLLLHSDLDFVLLMLITSDLLLSKLLSQRL